MQGLKISLWIMAVLCLAAAVCMALPLNMIEIIFKYIGIEITITAPVLIYMTRLTSAGSAVVGVFFIVLALNPMKYGIIVPFAGVSTLFTGLVCGTVGIISVMPKLWFLGDTISGIVLGLAILIFWQKAKKASGSSADTM